ncbi:polysulfide reductase NrfD [Thermostilla marina]
MKAVGKGIVGLIWLVLLLVGLPGVVTWLTSGRDAAAYGSYVPWGLWVSAYIYFIGLSAGAFLLSSLVYVFGVKKLEKIGRMALILAVTTLFIALLSIWIDLGHKWRFWEVFTRPHFTSMMAWMVWLYTAYFILILAELWFDLRCDLSQLASQGGSLAPLYRLLSLGHKCPSGDGAAACREKSRKTLQVLGALGIPLAIAFHGGVGALFATLSARPYWHSSLVPIFFLTGALLSGGGLLMAIVALTGDDNEQTRDVLKFLGKIVLGLLVFDLLLEWAEFSIPLWYAVGSENAPIYMVLFGKFWYVFWIVHLLLGAAIPLVLLLAKPGSRVASLVGGGLIALTFLAVRLNIVIPAQVVPQLEGLQNAFIDKRLRFEYVPSVFEWSMVAFIAALGITIFYLGCKLLPVETTANE